MNRFRILSRLAVLLSLALPACSVPQKSALITAIGPAPAEPPNSEDHGYLEVYSAWSHFVDPGSTPHHSRYTIRADDRATSRVIINHADRFDEGPLRLPLPPGSYHVSARSAHFGRVNVPVLIKPRLTTSIYLDGATHPQPPFGTNPSTVTLPDGEIVGWSAAAANNGNR